MALFQIAVQRGMGPILRGGAEARMHGAEIDQIPVTPEIGDIADFMFPVTSLPDGFFAALDLGQRAMCGHRAGTGEPRLEHRHPSGVIEITVWQGPKGIDRTGQDGDGVNAKGIAFQRVAHRLT